MTYVQIQGQRFQTSAILFDKDGTLLDFSYTWLRWADLMLSLLSPYAPKEGVRQALGLVASADGQHCADYDPAGPFAMASQEQITTLLTWQLYHNGMSWAEAILQVEQVLVETKRQFLSLQPPPVRAMPGLHTWLAACQAAGMPMAVVTSDTTEDALLHLQWLGIRDYFTCVIGCDQVAQGKPHPDMARLACEKLGVAVEEVLIIGDTSADMELARLAQAKAVLQMMPDEQTVRLSGAHAAFTDYRQLTILTDANVSSNPTPNNDLRE